MTMDDTISVKSASPTGTTASSGTKRKRNAEKFYAVRVGYHPGVYHTWADCLEQVKGFKKATCMSALRRMFCFPNHYAQTNLSPR